MNQPRKNQRGIYSKCSALAFKKYQINLSARSSLKSAGTEGVPSLLQSRIHRCPHPVTGQSHERVPWCAQAAAFCSQAPWANSSRAPKGFLWAVQNDTIHFYPGYCHRSCRISCFLRDPRSKGDMQKTPQAHLCCTEVPRAAPTNPCTQVKNRILPHWDKRDRITLFLSYFLWPSQELWLQPAVLYHTGRAHPAGSTKQECFICHCLGMVGKSPARSVYAASVFTSVSRQWT